MICPHCNMELEPLNERGDIDPVFGVLQCPGCGGQPVEAFKLQTSTMAEPVYLDVAACVTAMNQLLDALNRPPSVTWDLHFSGGQGSTFTTPPAP